MASTTTWILSLKVIFISAGVLSLALALKVSVPLILEFSTSQAPAIWSSMSSWLRPPYLYVIINGIIISIVASSRFQRREEENEKVERVFVPKIPVDPHPAVEYEMETDRFDFGSVESSTVVVERKQSDVEEKHVVVEDPIGDEEEVFPISNSTWNPPRRMDSAEILTEILLPAEKPLVSTRFGHRKPVNRANPEGVRALRVAKPKRHDTMENTWRMITEKKAMPLSRHLKKSETFKDSSENQATVDMPADSSPVPVFKKSETFKDRTNFQQLNSSPAPAKLRKEPSLSQDELNRRVEAFINKFNQEMRMQRQESLNQYKEMINC